MSKYILNRKGEPEPCADVRKWASWFEYADRRVAFDKLPTADVSTVFLGLDHASGTGAPVLWETLVIGGKLDGDTQRYTSKDDAIAGHKATVNRVRSAG